MDRQAALERRASVARAGKPRRRTKTCLTELSPCEAGHMSARDLQPVPCQATLNPKGRSLIAPPLSTAFCPFLLWSPYRGHGSLRGRRLPPQHLVRSTGAAMSTTGSRGTTRPNGLPRSLPAPSPRWATRTRASSCAGGSCQGFVRPPLAALTSERAHLNARCCAGSRTASSPVPHAPFQY